MKRHAVLPEALAEFDEAASWYEEEEAGLGLDRRVSRRVP